MSKSRVLAAVLAAVLLSGPVAAQEPPPIAPPSSTTTLAALLDELDQNNREVLAMRREVDVRVARIGPAGAPPDPTIVGGYMGGLLRPPFFPSEATPNGYRAFGVTQEFPFPGKLRLRSQIAAVGVDVARWDYEATRRRVVATFKRELAEYGYLGRALAIVARNRTVLQQVRDIAQARVSVGKAAQQDIIRAQIEISMLTERETMLEREQRARRAAINALLYRDPGTPVPDVPLAAAPDVPTEAQLRVLVPQGDPEIQRDAQGISQAQQSVALARKELLPDFGVNVTAQKMVGGMPWMYGADIMVRVPLFASRKQRPMIAEATAALEAARRTRENSIATGQARAIDALAGVTSSARLMMLYSDSVLPQARLALESSLSSYQVGTVDFLTMLTNVVSVLSYEISYEEQHARHLQALADLEPLTGLDLVR
jgi:outer membrane protein TolC